MNKNIYLDKYKHISFDLDGTLVHTTEEYRLKVVPETLEMLGSKIRDKHLINRFWFESGRDEIIKKEFGLDPEKFWKAFHKVDRPEKRDSYTKSYPDSERVIKSLKKLGKVISIITGAPPWTADMEIKKINKNLYDLFLSISDVGEELPPKPDPEGFHFALEKLNMKPEETIYIGNSNDDAYFAKNAGVDFLYLCRKEHDFDLRDYSVGKIHSLDELIS
jgi:phosphoglycolate phosphatase